MRLIILHLIFFVFTLVSCNPLQKKSILESDCEIISIEKAFDKKSKVLLSEYVSSLDYIPLETAPNCMLDGVSSLNIRVYDGRIYLYNKYYSMDRVKTLPLLFGADGSFITSIGAVGNSNDEFINIKNVMIDESARQLVIVDYNRFLFYTLSGEFKRATDVAINSVVHFTIFCTNDKGYVYLKNPSLMDGSTWDKDFLVRVDSLGITELKVALKRILLDQPGTPMGTAKVTKGANIFQSSENIYAYMHNDSLYKVNPLDLTFTSEFYIDFGKYSTTERAGATLWAMDNPLFITERMVCLTVLFTYGTFSDIDRKYTRTNFIYDRKQGITKAFEYNDEYGYAGFTNDIDGGMLFYPKYMNNGKMYQLVDAIDFIEYAQMGNSAKMKEIAATLTEESNPVMVVATLKE